MKLVNVGCGNVFHQDWINLDLSSNSPYITVCNIKKGLPFGDKSVDVIYSSHMIEHLEEKELHFFLKEAYRVLKDGGIIRLVTPDLEGIVESYLRALKQVRVEASKQNEADYDWMMLELYDQTVRNYSGGRMGDYLRRGDIVNKDFIISRIGHEAQNFWSYQGEVQIPTSTISKIKRYIKNQKCVQWLLKRMNTESKFRKKSGEIHKWMYDSFALARLFKNHGFKDTKIYACSESNILKFKSYDLEKYQGKERKPDSLYMEAYK